MHQEDGYIQTFAVLNLVGDYERVIQRNDKATIILKLTEALSQPFNVVDCLIDKKQKAPFAIPNLIVQPTKKTFSVSLDDGVLTTSLCVMRADVQGFADSVVESCCNEFLAQCLQAAIEQLYNSYPRQA